MLKQTLALLLILPFISTYAAPPQNTFSIQDMLVSGTTNQKLMSLSIISQSVIDKGIDESFLDGLDVCSKEKSLAIRCTTAKLIGQNFTTEAGKPNARALQILERLAQDPSKEVRYDAIHFGLTKIQPPTPKLAKLLLDVAEIESSENTYYDIVSYLKDYQPQVTAILNEKQRSNDSLGLFEIYEDFTGKLPAFQSKYLTATSLRPVLFVLTGRQESLEKAMKELELKSTIQKKPIIETFYIENSPARVIRTFTKHDQNIVKAIPADFDDLKIIQTLWLTKAVEEQLKRKLDDSTKPQSIERSPK